MLTRLEAKGFLKHREEGLRYVYSPTSPPAAARRKALQQQLSVFFGGSPAKMAAALLRNEKWTDEELDALQAEIDLVRKQRRQS
jgi:predicted transcriptional regulator